MAMETRKILPMVNENESNCALSWFLGITKQEEVAVEIIASCVKVICHLILKKHNRSSISSDYCALVMCIMVSYTSIENLLHGRKIFL